VIDDDQFEALIAMHHGEIYRYLLLITGIVDDADSLSRDTFLRAFKTRPLAGDVTDTRRWLFATATDLSRARLRSRRRPARSPIVKEGRSTARGQEHHTVAMAAIRRLSSEQQIALALRKLHDFDYEGIGRMLGCSSKSARGSVMRAFRKLARMRLIRLALRSVMASRTVRGPASEAAGAGA